MHGCDWDRRRCTQSAPFENLLPPSRWLGPGPARLPSPSWVVIRGTPARHPAAASSAATFPPFAAATAATVTSGGAAVPRSPLLATRPWAATVPALTPLPHGDVTADAAGFRGGMCPPPPRASHASVDVRGASAVGTRGDGCHGCAAGTMT